jgi:hypothetical protein
MTNRVLFLLLLATLFYSCKVNEKNIAGTYRLKGPSRTKLVLHTNKTFEFVKNFAEPGPLFFPDSTEMNYRTTGNWQLSKNGALILNSFPGAAPLTEPAADSILTNTSLTSFSFWNKYGDPVSIRFMKFPPDKIKLYKANIVSFFAEDFSKNDTLEFHFYGYPPVKWPGSFKQPGSGNISHHVTLYEEDRHAIFKNVVLQADRKKLLAADKSFALYKKD